MVTLRVASRGVVADQLDHAPACVPAAARGFPLSGPGILRGRLPFLAARPATKYHGGQGGVGQHVLGDARIGRPVFEVAGLVADDLGRDAAFRHPGPEHGDERIGRRLLGAGIGEENHVDGLAAFGEFDDHGGGIDAGTPGRDDGRAVSHWPRPLRRSRHERCGMPVCEMPGCDRSRGFPGRGRAASCPWDWRPPRSGCGRYRR